LAVLPQTRSGQVKFGVVQPGCIPVIQVGSNYGLVTQGGPGQSWALLAQPCFCKLSQGGVW
jgi:hypothetical protein